MSRNYGCEHEDMLWWIYFYICRCVDGQEISIDVQELLDTCDNCRRKAEQIDSRIEQKQSQSLDHQRPRIVAGFDR